MSFARKQLQLLPFPRQGGSRGGSRIFFRRCTRLLLYFNANKPHGFFLHNTSYIRKPQVISEGRGGGGGAHPLHPPSRSAPGKCSVSPRFQTSFFVSPHRNFAYVKMPLFWSFQINLIWPFQHRKKNPVVFEFHDFAISLNQRDD